MLDCVRAWLGLRLGHRGATALEYAFIGSIVAAAIAAGFSGLGTDLSNKFASVAGALTH
jgi:Flp pilus assembly pilin Flp